MSLSKAELERYSRHLIIPEFNIEGQQKLKKASVLVIGSGGLGSPLLLYLAAAGVGRIGLVDFDRVDETNLQRQVIFGVDDVGQPKVEAAASRLRQLNPHIEVEVHDTRFTAENARELIRGYDVVADGTDNFQTRYLVNDASVLEGKPNVYASIFRFEGQCTVFNQALPDGTRGPNYRDLFPTPPPPGLVPSCAEGGVIGVLPGILGSLQALEVIKVITGVGETLSGRLFLFDAATFTTRTVKVRKSPKNPLTGDEPTQTELVNYEAFCGVGAAEAKAETPVREITPRELKAWRYEERAHLLIDVREPYEYGIAEMGGELIPLASVEESKHRIPKDRPVVIHCRSGVRSARAVRTLEAAGYTNLYSLKGGILAWQAEVQPELARY
jgi:adenylyltransferase/sulfurtransferase